jgi:pimeloyl-ACP methyl ester carboxylesterase
MSIVVGVHGIVQRSKAARDLEQEWEAPVLNGVLAAGAELEDGAVRCAFYGRLFRGEPHYQAGDVTPDEAELLMLLWREAARAEPRRVAVPDVEQAGAVQTALRELLGSKFFAGLTEPELISDLKHVLGYMRDANVRDAAQEAVDYEVDKDTRVIVAHSLGSVVAYEALQRFGGTPRWANVKTLVTLGSPLGTPKLIFDQLRPVPDAGVGRWPAGIEKWTNIAADGDVFALTEKLRPLFGGTLVDIGVNSEATAHDVLPYLTSAATCRAIAEGLE